VNTLNQTSFISNQMCIVSPFNLAITSSTLVGQRPWSPSLISSAQVPSLMIVSPTKGRQRPSLGSNENLMNNSTQIYTNSSLCLMLASIESSPTWIAFSHEPCQTLGQIFIWPNMTCPLHEKIIHLPCLKHLNHPSLSWMLPKWVMHYYIHSLHKKT